MVTDGDYTIGDYLLDRLAEVGVTHLFGVPGDFTLRFLDHVEAHTALTWVGCTNELNAAYAADGYGRVKGVAALSTTFGVGELSALNGLAGSFAEYVPVIEIVGGPRASVLNSSLPGVHHTLGGGEFGQFMAMHEPVTCARTVLQTGSACIEIDRVITAVLTEHRPGYLLLPADVAESPAARPDGPLVKPTRPIDGEALEEFRSAVEQLLDEVAPTPTASVLSGMLPHRFGVAAALQELLDVAHVTGSATLWGKSAVHETGDAFVGMYVGAASDPAVRRAVEDADVLILAGVQFTDLTSAGFSQHLRRQRTIDLTLSTASVGAARFPDVGLEEALRVLTDVLKARDLAAPISPWKGVAQEPGQGAEVLDQRTLWQAVQEILRPGDLLVADIGTASFGASTLRLPADSLFLSQPLWASIGYSMPALLGAMLAAPGRRALLFIGDGAAQVTGQELSSLLRLGLEPLVCVLFNGGYTVERAIHGPTAAYNDIQPWDWGLIARGMAAGRGLRTHRVRTLAALRDALQAPADELRVVEVVTAPDDVPPMLARVAEQLSSTPPSFP